MLFADGNPDVATVGAWMTNLFWFVGTICAVVVAVAHIVLASRKTKPAPESEYITRGELSREIDRLDKDLKAIQEYNRVTKHDQGKMIHVINLRLVWVMALLTQLCGKQGIPVPEQPTISVNDEA